MAFLSAFLAGCVKDDKPISLVAEKSKDQYGRCIYQVKLTNTSTNKRSRIERVSADLFLKDMKGTQIGRAGLYLKTDLKTGESAIFKERVDGGMEGHDACLKATSYSIVVKRVSYY